MNTTTWTLEALMLSAHTSCVQVPGQAIAVPELILLLPPGRWFLLCHLLLNKPLCPLPQELPPAHLPALSWRVHRSPGSRQAYLFACISPLETVCSETALLEQEKAGCLLYGHKDGFTATLLTMHMIFLAGETGQGQRSTQNQAKSFISEGAPVLPFENKGFLAL